jgi:hypothetical protein
MHSGQHFQYNANTSSSSSSSSIIDSVQKFEDLPPLKILETYNKLTIGMKKDKQYDLDEKIYLLSENICILSALQQNLIEHLSILENNAEDSNTAIALEEAKKANNLALTQIAHTVQMLAACAAHLDPLWLQSHEGQLQKLAESCVPAIGIDPAQKLAGEIILWNNIGAAILEDLDTNVLTMIIAFPGYEWAKGKEYTSLKENFLQSINTSFNQLVTETDIVIEYLEKYRCYLHAFAEYQQKMLAYTEVECSNLTLAHNLDAPLLRIFKEYKAAQQGAYDSKTLSDDEREIFEQVTTDVECIESKQAEEAALEASMTQLTLTRMEL